MICSKCGKELPDGVAFCPSCGAAVKKKTFCGKCGAEIAPGQSFCAACGTPVTKTPPVQNSTQANPTRPIVPQQYAQAQKVAADRSFGKVILLTIITLGIYGIIVLYQMSEDINTIASKYDGKKTMNYLLAVLLTPITLGIFGLVWTHQFCGRIGAELERRGISYQFSSSTFWLWNVLGTLIVVGPFVFWSKLITAMNLLGDNYNTYG